MSFDLSNGHKFNFGCSSGALGFCGDGWPWEYPFRWLGLLRPEEFTIITKTLTAQPRRGNLVWYAPWRSVKLLPNNSVVNAVGLTNPGIDWWMAKCHDYATNKYNIIVSVSPFDEKEAEYLAEKLNSSNLIKGVQLNVSCPNAKVDDICVIVRQFIKNTKHPVILKLSYMDDYVELAKELGKLTEGIELINSIPYNHIFKNDSPLKRYGYDGGVSGGVIKKYARKALQDIKSLGLQTPVVSGGGIDSLEEVLYRKKLGCDGIVFGSVFIRKPWKPNKIIDEYNKLELTKF